MARQANRVPVVGPMISVLLVRTACAGVSGILDVQVIPRLASGAVGVVAPETELAVWMALLTGLEIEIPVINTFGTLISIPTKA